MKKIIIVDVESDGQVPGINSMVCFGAVFLDKEGKFDKTFYGQTSPISKVYNKEALAISGFSREQHEKFQKPEVTMLKFNEWLRSLGNGNNVLYSDNNQYDGMFMNYYCHVYLGMNPFGFSSRRIADLICGFEKDTSFKWKHLRKTKHDHNPINDAIGNAEALLHYVNMGLKL